MHGSRGGFGNAPLAIEITTHTEGFADDAGYGSTGDRESDMEMGPIKLHGVGGENVGGSGKGMSKMEEVQHEVDVVRRA